MTDLTKKEFFALYLMQGLISNPEVRLDSRLAAKFAIKYAQHLIEELNDEEAKPE